MLLPAAARPALFAAVALALLPAAAENWREWQPLPGQEVSAAFEPFVDMRDGKIDKSAAFGYANLAKRTPFPGEIVFSGALSGDGGVLTAGAFEIVVDAVLVDEDHSGKPSVGKGDHYAQNPFLPYAMPTGPCDAPSATARYFVPQGRAEEGIRVPVVLPNDDVWHGKDAVYRIRWRILSAGNGSTIARGILPEAFSYNTRHNDKTHDVVYATAGSASRAKTRPGRATKNTWGAWPALVESFSSVVFDDAGFDEAFAGEDPAAVSNFIARAWLINLDLSRKSAKGGEASALPGPVAGPRPIAIPQRGGVRLRGADAATPFSQSAVAVHVRDSNNGAGRSSRGAGKKEKADARFNAIRIPGETLWRPTAPFAVATAAFLAAFALGSVVLLVFFFAFRKGERRLAVWYVLPAWCVLCSLAGWFALPLALDRRPYSDVTEWRYSIEGLDESFCIAKGRAQTFKAEPTAWSVPGGAWFGMPHHWKDRYARGRVFGFDGGEGGGAALLPSPRNAGAEDRAIAFRFAPREPAVTLSPDPEFSFDGFLREASRAPSAEDGGETRRRLAKFLSEWSDAEFRKPGKYKDGAPAKRSVTAHRALDGVFVFARGSWFALGPMAAGETRTLDSSMEVVSGIETDGMPDFNLFDDAPFAVVAKDIKSFASAWLAREKGGKRGEETETDEPAEKRRKNPIDEYGAGEIEDIVGRLGSAFAVSIIRQDGQDGQDGPFLSPAFPGSARDAQTTGRIATVEVFP